jgi:hypothetical protein
MDAGNVVKGALPVVTPGLQVETKGWMLEELDEIFEVKNPRKASIVKTEICQHTIKNKHGGDNAEVSVV